MPALHYARTENEVHEPTGVVIRSLPDGKLDAQVINGGNEQVNTVVTVLATIIDKVGIDTFMPMARAAIASAGLNIDELIADSEKAEAKTSPKTLQKPSQEAVDEAVMSEESGVTEAE